MLFRSQLSLAIGKEGQNARLAAKLTGYKIDIKPESAAEEFIAPEVEDAMETAGEELDVMDDVIETASEDLDVTEDVIEDAEEDMDVAEDDLASVELTEE